MGKRQTHLVMNPIAIPDSHWRFAESSFRRFEPIVASLVNAWPTAQSISPDVLELSPATFVSRFRDSLQAFTHPDCTWSSSLSPTTVSRIFRFLGSSEPLAFVLTHTGRTVIFAPRKSALVSQSTHTLSPIASGIDAADNLTTLHAFCHLISKGFLSDQVEFFNFPDELQTTIQEQYPELIIFPITATSAYIS